jgi:hypothetical protein
MWQLRRSIVDPAGWAGEAVDLPAFDRPQSASRSTFAGFRFPAEVITLSVRWYLRFGLSYRDVEELLGETR